MAANDSGAEDNALRLWALLTLEIWQQTYLDGTTDVPQVTGEVTG